MTDQPPPADAAEPTPTPLITPAYMPTGRRRLLLVGCSVLFALWIAALLAMYFGEVYPHRHPKGTTPPTLPQRP